MVPLIHAYNQPQFTMSAQMEQTRFKKGDHIDITLTFDNAIDDPEPFIVFAEMRLTTFIRLYRSSRTELKVVPKKGQFTATMTLRVSEMEWPRHTSTCRKYVDWVISITNSLTNQVIATKVAIRK